MLFLDTSVIVAYKNADDINHGRALRIIGDLAKGTYSMGLVTEYTILETVTVLKRKCDSRVAIEAGEALLNSREIKVIPSAELFDATWQEFANLARTDLGFVDVSNLVAMRLYGTRRIATFDGEFRKLKGIEVVN